MAIDRGEITSEAATPVVVVMGVSGSGKSVIGRRLASALGFRFTDADDFHGAENVAKMASGRPLTDEDRAPWLSRLRAHIDAARERREPTVLACSALKQRYRVYLRATPELVERRLAGRTGHFMPEQLIPSQFADLEPPAHAITIDADQPIDAIVSQAKSALSDRSR
jgi:carbohydrate kinase (thermoresistant glucokinase family)